MAAPPSRPAIAIAELLGTTASARAALALPRRSEAQVAHFLAAIRVLARPSAIELGLAMAIAWCARQDPADLGYSSLTSFYAERVDWRPSWRKHLVALVNSDLDEVKRAACEGELPLRLAVSAPGRVAAERQQDWLAAPEAPPPPAAEARVLDTLAGDDAVTVRRARSEARICMGRAASQRAVDAYLVDCHREQRPAEQILAEARTAPPAPEAPPSLSWHWCRTLWSEPSSVDEALERIEQLQAVLRGRTAVLAQAWVIVRDEALWVDAGLPSLEAFATEVLGVCPRTSTRWLERLGWGLTWYPELRAAVRDGLSPRSAEAIASLQPDHQIGRWLAVAERVGRQELGRAVSRARRHGESGPTLDGYERAIALADVVDAQREGLEGAATSAGPTRVALPQPEPAAASGEVVRAPRKVLDAARWWCETVQMPRQRGFGCVKERDRYTCRNPECGRVTLRAEAHHLVFRSEGGPDTDDNGVTLCRCCHLRGVHGGKLRVERISVRGVAARLWSWPDGRRVLEVLEAAEVAEAAEAAEVAEVAEAAEAAEVAEAAEAAEAAEDRASHPA